MKTKIVRYSKIELEKAIAEKRKDKNWDWYFSKINTKYKSYGNEYFVIAERKIKEGA